MTFPEHLKLFNMTFLKMTVLVIYSCGSKDSLEICGCVLVFQVPMVMLSLARIFDDAPVAYLTPPSWCTAEGGPIWYGMDVRCHRMVSLRQSTT